MKPSRRSFLKAIAAAPALAPFLARGQHPTTSLRAFRGGMHIGFGVPTIVAAQGSLYLRYDSDTCYVNIDGTAKGWRPIARP